MPSAFSISRPYRGLFYVQFPDRPGILGEVDMAFHFLRFQEHYESPGFKGTVFSWADYVVWYKSVRGAFSYAHDWGGYNFPGAILDRFRRGDFHPLTRREQTLLTALAEVGPDDYVIATQADDPEALGHELAHAFWHLDSGYREGVQAVLAGGDYRKQHASLAQGEGYDPSVFEDEIQASAIDGDPACAPELERAVKIRFLFEEAQRRRSNFELTSEDR